jgi:hypothetical protein
MITLKHEQGWLTDHVIMSATGSMGSNKVKRDREIAVINNYTQWKLHARRLCSTFPF